MNNRIATPGRARLGNQGFTLVEVLAAMVILAVGLLALEAMAIGAARQVARAERVSEFSAVATDQLERTLEAINATGAGTIGADSINGVEVVTDIDQQAAGTRTVFTVTVTVTPPSTQSVSMNPITMVGRAVR